MTDLEQKILITISRFANSEYSEIQALFTATKSIDKTILLLNHCSKTGERIDSVIERVSKPPRHAVKLPKYYRCEREERF